MSFRSVDTRAAFVIAEPSPDEVAACVDTIESAMNVFNEAAIGAENERQIVLVARNAAQGLVGGLVASTSWDYINLENLWVDPSQRGGGVGAALIGQLEDIGRARGLRMIQLYTFSFEAPRFYEKLGYTLAGKIENAPEGTTDHWFYKRLVPAA